MKAPLKPSTGKWPKMMPELSPEQIQISNDWMRYFHSINRSKYSGIINFGHEFAAARSGGPSMRTLEIGAGLGGQLNYEPQSRRANYIAIERRWNMASELHRTFPEISTCLGDCQGFLPIQSASMDRVIAIHVLEHLPDLPSCLRAVLRILKPGGKFIVVIPCEGGIAYAVARYFTSKQLFEKRYKTPYEWHIRSEHVNMAWEILEELDKYFVPEETSYYPFHLPLVHLNAAVALSLSPRPNSQISA